MSKNKENQDCLICGGRLYRDENSDKLPICEDCNFPICPSCQERITGKKQEEQVAKSETCPHCGEHWFEE